MLVLTSLCALTAAAACGDDETTATTVNPASSSTGSSSSSGSGGAGGGGAADCASYCSGNITTCVGNNTQYLDQGQCEAFCANFTQGTAGETTGDTLECRSYHLGAAAGDADTHCHHSGPYGGGACSTAGNVCDTFCAYVMGVCTGMNAAFNSLTECATTCAALPDVAGAMYQFMAATTGDGLNCRGYHLQAAAGDPATHCKHVGATDPLDDPCQ